MKPSKEARAFEKLGDRQDQPSLGHGVIEQKASRYEQDADSSHQMEQRVARI